MKSLKRLLSLVLTLSMLIGTMVFSPSEAYASSFTDVADSAPYANATSALVALNILSGYEDGSFRPDNTITRAEFATLSTRMLGMGDFVSTSSAASVFTDIMSGGSEHWASGYIKMAYDLGIVSGMGDGTFAPDNPVTYEQAVKMIVCVLGYGDLVLQMPNYSWPSSWISQADALGITKGASVTPTSSAASRATVAILLYNALEADMAEKNATGVTASTKKNILSDKLKITSVKNYMVASVDGTDNVAESDKTVKEGQVLLSGSKSDYVCNYAPAFGKEKIVSRLGNYINAYLRYNSETEDYDLVYISDKSSKSSEITISSESVESYSAPEIEYYKDESTSKTYTAEIESGAMLIYNGVKYDYTEGTSSERDLSEWLDPNSDAFFDGQVRLLDSDGNKKYDTIFIEDYETYVVKNAVKTNDSVASNNYIIYDLYDSAKYIRLDPDSVNQTVEICDASGKAMKIENIKANNVVSVASSYDGSKHKAYVSSATVTGKVSEIDEDKFVVGDKAYYVTKSFLKAIDNDKVTAERGTNGTFYLDKSGRIAGAKIQVEETGSYGYITAAGLSDEVLAVRLLPASGTPSTPTKMELAETVKVNGKRYTDHELVYEMLAARASLIESNSDSGVTNSSYAQPVKYIKDSTNKITSLTLLEMSDDELELKKSSSSENIQMYIQKEDLYYSSSTGFKSKVFINSSTKVIVVPENRNSTDSYKRYSGTSYFKSGTTYGIEAYDVSNAGYAGLVLVYSGTSNNHVSYTTPMNLVSKVTTKTSSVKEDEMVYAVEVIQKNGSVKKYETESTDGDFANIKAGDCIRFVTNADGQICEVAWDLDVENLQNEFKYDTNSSGRPYETNGEYYYKTIYGTCSRVEQDFVVIAPEDVQEGEGGYTLNDEDAEGFTLNSSYACFRVDVGSNKVSVNTATIDDVLEFGDGNEKASKVFAQAYVGQLRYLIIYVTD